MSASHRSPGGDDLAALGGASSPSPARLVRAYSRMLAIRKYHQITMNGFRV